MSDLTNPRDASSALFDAKLSPDDLATITTNHPHLWARVAWHQNAYSELLDFLAANGDKSVVDAVATRRELLGEPTSTGPHLPSSFRAGVQPPAPASESRPSSTDLLDGLNSLFSTPLTGRGVPAAPPSPFSSSERPQESSLSSFDRLFGSSTASASDKPTPKSAATQAGQGPDTQQSSETDPEATGKIPVAHDSGEKPQPSRKTKKSNAREHGESLGLSEDEDSADATVGSSGKKIGIIALIVAVVIGAIVAGYFLLFGGSVPTWLGGEDKTPLTEGQFTTFTNVTFPEEADVLPFPVEDGKQNYSSCDNQLSMYEFALLRADPDQGQAISFRLFDTSAHAETYASQVLPCWTELGIEATETHTKTDGVTHYEMSYISNGKDLVTYYAVYHNVFAFTNFPARWARPDAPFAQFATGAFKTAIDRALASDPSATPTYTPPAPPSTTVPVTSGPTESGGESQPSESGAGTSDPSPTTTP